MAQVLSCSAAHGIFPDQGSNWCPLHCQVDSLPLSHQGSPFIYSGRKYAINFKEFPIYLLHTFYVVFFFFFNFFFNFTILCWFCHTSTCIHHGGTRVPHPEPLPHLPPHTIPLGHSSAPAPSFLYPASK